MHIVLKCFVWVGVYSFVHTKTLGARKQNLNPIPFHVAHSSRNSAHMIGAQTHAWRNTAQRTWYTLASLWVLLAHSSSIYECTHTRASLAPDFKMHFVGFELRCDASRTQNAHSISQSTRDSRTKRFCFCSRTRVARRVKFCRFSRVFRLLIGLATRVFYYIYHSSVAR